MSAGAVSRIATWLLTTKDDRADLSERSDVLIALMDDTTRWRERVVEELTFGSGAHVRASTALQIDFPPAFLAQFVDLATVRRANMLVPLGTRVKQPLLGLDIVGHAGAPAHLVSRASTAALEALYLELATASSPAAAEIEAGLPGKLLEAICVFSPDLFRSFLAEAGNELPADRMEIALARYLQSGFADAFDISVQDVRQWRERRNQVGEILTRRLEEERAVSSSSEEVLLALPRVDPLPNSKDEVAAIVAAYADAVVAADAAGDALLLSVIGEYGRRYELIVETEVPLLEPATITVAEDRPLNLRFGRSHQRFALGEARSAHLEARVTDPNVTLGRFDASRLGGKPVRLGPLESARFTPESISLYSSEPDRPYYVDVALRLRPRWHLRLTSYLLITLNVSAAITALVIGTRGELEARLAILVVPTTLATTFVLVREQTALLVRLLQLTRLPLGASTLMLWLVAVVQLYVDSG